jgi:hypothetical protein
MREVNEQGRSDRRGEGRLDIVASDLMEQQDYDNSRLKGEETKSGEAEDQDERWTVQGNPLHRCVHVYV